MNRAASERSNLEQLPPSDADRAEVIETLRSQLAADRLSLETFEQLAERVYAISSLNELREFRQRFTVDRPPPRRSHQRRNGTVALGLALLLVGALVTSRTRSSADAPTAEAASTIDTESPSRDSTLLQRSREEDWFSGCDLSDATLESAIAQGQTLERLADAVPEGTVEEYAVGFEGPVSTQSRPWTDAALLENGAVGGYAATFNQGPPGPGGWSVYLYRFPTRDDANNALHDAFRALVCTFGADPWTPDQLEGRVAATRPADTIEILWTTSDVLVVVNWSVYQDIEETQDRAQNAAAAVEAQLAQ